MEGEVEEDEVSSPEGSSSEDEPDRDDRTSEYEQRRLSRIKENRARLEALGLPHLASSLLGPLAKQQSSKGKRKAAKKVKGGGRVGVDDDEYRPSDEDDGEEDGGSSSHSEEQEEEEDYRPPSNSRQKGKKKDKNAAKIRKSPRVRGNMKEFDVFDDDVALQQAIALSLGGATVDPGAVLGGSSQSPGTNVADAGYRGSKDRGNIKETVGKRKIKKGNKSWVQLTEDEVVAYFFLFDVAGKGYITLLDLQRIVNAHDYTWPDMEMANMIHSFDSDGDGKLSLDDFRTIVTRCNMMQEPKE